MADVENAATDMTNVEKVELNDSKLAANADSVKDNGEAKPVPENSPKKKVTADVDSDNADENMTPSGEQNGTEDAKPVPVKRKKGEDETDEVSTPAKKKAKKDTADEADEVSTPAKKKAKKDTTSATPESKTKTTENETSEDSAKKSHKQKAKTKVQESEEDDEGSEGDEEEMKPGLLEQPVVLEEGAKREKKKVQRLELTPVSDQKDAKLVIAEGAGTKLGDIPRIELQLQKIHGEDLKHLHSVLFNKPGAAAVVKKHIRQFSGFTFARDSAEFKKKVEKMTNLKFTTTILKTICRTLDLETGGTKAEIVERIMDFLMKPKESGKKVPEKKKHRSSSGKGKKTPGKGKKKAAKKSKKKKESSDNEDVDESAGEDEAESDKSDAESQESDEGSASEDESPKKKKATPAKKGSPKKTPKSSAKSAEKRKSTESKKKPAKKAKEDSDSDSDGDEPLAKPKSQPTDNELKEVIKKILKTANLEEVTMKTVCKQVYDKFPEFDLTARKDFIKTTVKQILK